MSGKHNGLIRIPHCDSDMTVYRLDHQQSTTITNCQLKVDKDQSKVIKIIQSRQE